MIEHSDPRLALRSFCGKEVVRARLGIRPTLVIEAGKRIPDPAGDHRHEWYLWLQFCAWRIELRDAIALASNDESDDLRDTERVLGGLSGSRIRDLSLENPANDLVILFESGQ